MKKVLILAVCLFLANSYLNSGFKTSKDSLSGSAPAKHYSAAGKDQFLRAPQSAPVLLPLPNQSNPSSDSAGSTSQPKTQPAAITQTGSSSTAADQTPSPSPAPQPQPAATDSCTTGTTSDTTTPCPQPQPQPAPSNISAPQSCDPTETSC
jgi:hypothetical protein